MRSSELARLADVTVRTLRHYHQVGVLPEPRRTSNGYRDYGARDLIRLLRIKQLTTLGVPLEKVGSMLYETDSEVSRRVLQEMDDELAHRIAVLSRQRELLAPLRDSPAEADLPAIVGRYLTQLDRGDVPAPLRAAERDHALLLHHLLGSDLAEPLLSRSTATLVDQAELAAQVIEGFDALNDDSDERDIAHVTEILVQLVAPIVTDLPDDAGHSRHSSELITSMQRTSMNEVQREVIRRVGRGLSGPARRKGSPPGTGTRTGSPPEADGTALPTVSAAGQAGRTCPSTT